MKGAEGGGIARATADFILAKYRKMYIVVLVIMADGTLPTALSPARAEGAAGARSESAEGEVVRGDGSAPVEPPSAAAAPPAQGEAVLRADVVNDR